MKVRVVHVHQPNQQYSRSRDYYIVQIWLVDHWMTNGTFDSSEDAIRDADYLMECSEPEVIYERQS